MIRCITRLALGIVVSTRRTRLRLDRGTIRRRNARPVVRAGAAALLAILLIAGKSAPAATTSWNTTSGNFNATGNWTADVPGSFDMGVFRRGSAVTYAVTFPGGGKFGTTPVNYASDQLRVGNNSVSFVGTIAHSTYALDNTATTELGRSVIIGETAGDTAAVLTTSLVTFSCVAATVGDTAGSSGTLNVSGGTFNVSDSLVVGYSGTGTLTANGGDVSVSGTTVVGLKSGSHGTVNVSSTSSTLAAGLLLLGFYPGSGSGTLNITSGSMSGYGMLGGGGGGTANVTGLNSSWSSSGLKIYSGGTLNVSSGAQVTDANADFLVGYDSGGATIGGGSVNVSSGGILSTGSGPLGPHTSVKYGGAVTVTGAGSDWINTGSLDVGPLGSITISDGGTFSPQSSIINILAGSLTVRGTGSSLIPIAGGLNLFGSTTLTVADGGSVKELVSIGSGSTLTGNGITSGCISDGVIAPGDPLGTLKINTGGCSQHASGKLQIELGGTTAGTNYDQLIVTGGLSLGGTLQVSLVNSFTPSLGDRFKILGWDTRSGVFSTLQLPALASPLRWNVGQLYADGTLSVVDSNHLPGDFNRDNQVTGADIPLMLAALTDVPGYQLQYGVSDSDLLAIGDFDNSGSFTNADMQGLFYLLIHGGVVLGSPNPAAAVPEPTSIVLLGLGGLAIAFCRRSR